MHWMFDDNKIEWPVLVEVPKFEFMIKRATGNWNKQFCTKMSRINSKVTVTFNIPYSGSAFVYTYQRSVYILYEQ